MTNEWENYPRCYDVEDIRAHVRHALNDELKHNGATLNPTEYDDAIAYLDQEAIGLAKRYDASRAKPGAGKTTNFSTWSYRIIRYRYADWLRCRYHDNRSLPPDDGTTVQTIVSGDAQVRNPDTSAGSGRMRLVDTLPSRQGDPSVNSATDLRRALAEGSREDAGLLHWQSRANARRAG